MTDTIEAVARAIAECNEPGQWDKSGDFPDNGEIWRDGYINDARAAIIAVRKELSTVPPHDGPVPILSYADALLALEAALEGIS